MSDINQYLGHPDLTGRIGIIDTVLNGEVGILPARAVSQPDGVLIHENDAQLTCGPGISRSARACFGVLPLSQHALLFQRAVVIGAARCRARLGIVVDARIGIITLSAVLPLILHAGLHEKPPIVDTARRGSGSDIVEIARFSIGALLSLRIGVREGTPQM